MVLLSLLGSKTLGTKCIRTTFVMCWQTMIKTENSKMCEKHKSCLDPKLKITARLLLL